MPQKGYDSPRFLKPLLLSADFPETGQSVCKRTKALWCPQRISSSLELLSSGSDEEYHWQGRLYEVCVETAFQDQAL